MKLLAQIGIIAVLGFLFFDFREWAHAADAPKPAAPALPVETLRNDTAGLLVINVSGQVVGFVFVSHTGQILPERSEACEAKDECRTLVRGLIESGKVTTVYAGEQPSPVT